MRAVYGYVRPFVPDLRVAEFERYRAVYCGLCRCMGKATGQLSRVSVSYDFTFYAAVRLILAGEIPEFVLMRCPAHPGSRRMTAKETPALLFSAAVSASFADAKTRDDLADERGFSRFGPIVRSPFTAGMSRRAEKLLPPGAKEGICERLALLGEAEKERSPSADRTSKLFGSALGFAFALGLEGEKAEKACRIGEAAGRFVYLCDAAEDLPGDVKQGRYNPLAEGYGKYALGEDGKLSPMVRESLAAAVPILLEPLGEEADSLDPAHPLAPVVKNIVYLGLPSVLNRVLSGDGKGKRKAGKEGIAVP